MKVAGKVILILDSGDGVAATISDSLRPNPTSSFKVLNESFEFPLESYGIKEKMASGKITHFISSNGHFEVSILVVQNYEPPILACALNEVLLKLAGEDLSSTPTLIVPFVLPEYKLKQESKYATNSDKVSVYGIKIGPTTDVTQALSSKLEKPSPSLRINQEDLATLLHLLNVVKLPTVVLIGQTGLHVSNKASKDELEVMCQIGEQLSSVTPLTFSNETMIRHPTKTSRDGEEAWRALYG